MTAYCGVAQVDSSDSVQRWELRRGRTSTHVATRTYAREKVRQRGDGSISEERGQRSDAHP
jgi:hypothetical protein